MSRRREDEKGGKMNKNENRSCNASKATDFDRLHLYINDVLFDRRSRCLSIIY